MGFTPVYAMTNGLAAALTRNERARGFRERSASPPDDRSL